ncbi:MAG: hypothetical protein IPI27_18360 [Betaproteobacteria bacterium]|nr:hypothetical protein [Betaproteobacteria bacterium]
MNEDISDDDPFPETRRGTRQVGAAGDAFPASEIRLEMPVPIRTLVQARQGHGAVKRR